MQIRLIAVGSRMPQWVREAYEEYARRAAPVFKISLIEIEPGIRGVGHSADKAVQTEARKLLNTVRPIDYVVALDERGVEMTTRELAAWLDARMRAGQDLAFLVGGPDGLGSDALARADYRWSLSRLTFPHALVRVIFAEQLYRAYTVLSNHPYHRD
jgi:23S rRNA (pseudouridine1915-N3)-methyltransferase